MAKIETTSDPRIIEAEEHLLLDFQIAIQEIMAENNVSRSQLADLSGLSKARLTQILGNEANPTVKTMARLFHALGKRACVSAAPLDVSPKRLEAATEWQWDEPNIGEVRIDDKLVAVVKDTGASNDNYDDRFVLVDPDLVAA